MRLRSFRALPVALLALSLAHAAPAEPVASVAFSPDGRWVAGRSRGGAVAVWEVAGGRLQRTMRDIPAPGVGKVPAGPEAAILFTPNGKALASPGIDTSPGKGGSDRAVVHLWDPESGHLIRSLISGAQAPQTTVFLDHGATLAGLVKMEVVVWDARTGRVKRRLQPTRLPGEDRLVASPDGRLLALVPTNPEEEEGPVVWDLRTGETVGPPANAAWLRVPAFAPTAAVLTRKGDRKGPEIVDLATVVIPTETSPPAISTIIASAASPKEHVLATATSDGMVRLWDADTLTPRGALPGFAGTVTALATSADGRMVAAGNAAGEIRLWDARNRKLLRVLKIPPA